MCACALFCDPQTKRYESLETVEERRTAAREIYDKFIMRELLSHTHVSPIGVSRTLSADERLASHDSRLPIQQAAFLARFSPCLISICQWRKSLVCAFFFLESFSLCGLSARLLWATQSVVESLTTSDDVARLPVSLTFVVLSGSLRHTAEYHDSSRAEPSLPRPSSSRVSHALPLPLFLSRHFFLFRVASLAHFSHDRHVSNARSFLSTLQAYSKKAVDHVQKHLMKNEVPVTLFQPYIEEIFSHLRGDIFRKFIERYVTVPTGSRVDIAIDY